MDPVLNPFSSGLSSPPPLLAGRQSVVEHARLFFARVAQGRGEKSLLLSGLRGSGKTVLLQALARLAEDAGVAVQCVDDAETRSGAELKALIQAQEAHLRLQEPKAVLLAALPLNELLDDASHALASRVFRRFDLEALSPEDAALAVEPHVQTDAVPELLRLSKGYPAFLQAWAYGAWNAAPGPRISRADLKACADAVLRRLDADFYGPGFERLSPREKAYLRTMAHLGPGPHRSGDIADSMDAKITSLGPLRAKLIAGGWVYSPGHGMLGFTAPGFDEFMRRVMPGFR